MGRPLGSEEVLGSGGGLTVGDAVVAVGALVVGVADSVTAGAVVGTAGLPLADGLDGEKPAAKTSVDATNA